MLAANGGWDHDPGALECTGWLQLPGWLNWITAHIGHHPVHQLSVRIRLAQVPAGGSCLGSSV